MARLKADNSKNKRLELRVDEDFIDILSGYAENNNMSISDVVRVAVGRLVDDMTADDLIKFQDLFRCPKCKTPQ